MTQLEKILYAKTFMDKLANGINPLDDTPIPDGDIANNVRLSRCFFFVSDILRQVCERGGLEESRRAPKLPFSVTPEQAARFRFSETPVSVTELASRINELVDTENMHKVSYRQITEWLLEIGMLYLVDPDARRSSKRPTEQGYAIGISTEQRTGSYGSYTAILYSREAQSFILDNLEAVLAAEYKKGKKTED